MEQYFSAQEASCLLTPRSALRQEVERWWELEGLGPPPLPSQVNLGVLAPPVATCRFEDLVFVRECEQAGLHPSWCQYLGDRFCSTSKYKMSLVRPHFFERRGRNGGEVVRTDKRFHPVWDGRLDGTPLRSIYTSDGESLVDFHHAHHRRILGEATTLWDITDWYRKMGRAKDYYPGLLSIFIAHGVLFEDYQSGEDGDLQDKFRDQVFLPAYHQVAERFGAPPLLVRLGWRNELSYFPRTLEAAQDALCLGRPPVRSVA